MSPDKKVPAQTSLVLHILIAANIVNNLESYGPMVVHCR